MKTVKVVAAVIQEKGEILCMQRGPHKFDYLSEKFEFPGGKIEQGETEEEALRREIREELLMEISIDGKLMTVEHRYPDFMLEMHAYLCSTPDRKFTLTEHISFEWSSLNDLEKFDWAAADIPIVKRLLDHA